MSILSYPNQSSRDTQILYALGMSLILHLFFLSLINIKKPTKPGEHFVRVMLQPVIPEQSKKNLIDEPTIDKQQKQIVSQPDKIQEGINKDTRLLSERESFAEKDQIKRGEGEKSISASSGSKEKNVAPPAKLAATKKQLAERRDKAPSLTTAKPPASDVARLHLSEDAIANGALFSKQQTSPIPPLQPRPADDKANLKEALSSAAPSNYQPFSHGSSFTRPGERAGISDYLPSIPDGDVTLLNTKASQYATFVRRVATQVFAALRRSSWSTIPYTEVQRVSGFSVLQAKLSPEGKLLALERIDSSGSYLFDKVVTSAVETGSWDKNPPEGARASDGNIYFIFKARTWARPVANAVQEQRWILLGTGLL